MKRFTKQSVCYYYYFFYIYFLVLHSVYDDVKYIYIYIITRERENVEYTLQTNNFSFTRRARVVSVYKPIGNIYEKPRLKCFI